jgi:glycosyltransferase involved in cell wall biosynthesis
MANILFFTYDYPFPTNSGGKMRAFNMMKFGGTGHKIYLISFFRNSVTDADKKELEKIGVETIDLFKRKPAKNIGAAKSVISLKSSIFKNLYFEKKNIDRIIQIIQEYKIDILHTESFYTGFYLSKALNVKQVNGTENIEYKLYEEYIKKIPPIARIPFAHQVSKIKNEEKHMAQTADITLAVTKEEADYFNSIGASKTAVIPNGVDTDEFKFKKNTRPNGTNILFVGNFSYFPNRDAMEFFYYDVFRNMNPEYRLRVIGKGGDTLGIRDSRVEFISFVPDIKEEYYRADVMVSPIRIGGGTNFKLIEAAACGTPIVMHSSRIDSVGFQHGEHVLAADNPSEFMTELEKLLQNDALQGNLARNARQFIEKNYSWESIGKKLSTVWSDLSL